MSAPYTFGQLEALWTGNGGSPAWAPTMAAVALAESGGNPGATNPSGATGLWQIEWPLHKGVAGTTTQSQLLDPNTNAEAAVSLLGGGAGFCSGWKYDPVGALVCGSGGAPLPFASAVSAAKSLTGATSAQLSDAIDPTSPHATAQLTSVWSEIQKGADYLGGGLVGGSVLQTGGGLLAVEHDAASVIGTVTSASFWLRTGEIVGGGLLMIFGFLILNRGTVEKVAETAAVG